VLKASNTSSHKLKILPETPIFQTELFESPNNRGTNHLLDRQAVQESVTIEFLQRHLVALLEGIKGKRNS
jgi:hypothetical protein